MDLLLASQTRFLLTALCWLLIRLPISAQADLQFEYLSEQDGLSQNSVLSIQQDQEGFMWFGTVDGLNKYDGYRFTVFRSDPRDTKSTIQENYINDIHEDRQGQLWVGTVGLYLLDKRTGKVKGYLADSSRFTYLNVNLSIHEDKQGVLWTGVGGGINRFDPVTGRFTSYLIPQLVPNPAIVEDGNGTFWVGSSIGLFQFNPKRGTFKAFPVEHASNPNPSISDLFIDADGLLWIGTEGEGIFRLDPRQTPTQAVGYNPGGQLNKWIAKNGIIQDQRGFLWVATSDGLHRINKDTNQVTTYRADPSQTGRLNSNNVLSVYEDRAGTLWVGTDNGINKVITSLKPFHTRQVKYAAPPIRLQENRINTLLEDKSGIIWLGTTRGLYQYIPHRNQIYSVRLTSTDTGTRSTASQKESASANIHVIHEDQLGRLWVGTSTGLYLRNPTTGAFKHYPCKIPVQFLARDPFQKFWIPGGIHTQSGTAGKAVMAVFDLQKRAYSYTEYKLDDPTGLKEMYLYGVMASRNGDIWVATQSKGISRRDHQTGTFIHYEPGPDPVPNRRLNFYGVLCIYEDQTGIIWVGTRQGGLNRLDPKTGLFSYVTTHDGLASNFIASITGDKRGNLWLGTNKGLSCFTPKTGIIRNFDQRDGLPRVGFNIGSVFSRHGKLLFGSGNGFVAFHPDSIKIDAIVPPVYITGLKVLEKPRDLPQNQIELSYKENFIAFDFVSLDYHAPEKIRYSYWLENFEPTWSPANTRQYVSYTNLPAGDYTFHVKAANGDGIWNQKGASLRIIIYPPWWRTWWAYGVYGLLFIAGVWAFIQYRSRALRRENRLLEEKVALRTDQLERKSHELEHSLDHLKATQAQLVQKEKMASLGELTAGIAHEIQNPLNFVNNFSEVSIELVDELDEEIDRGDTQEAKTISGDLRQNLHKITLHGQRASSIVKGMLEHSRSNNGERAATDLNALADDYLHLAYHGFRTKYKDFSAELSTDFDSDLGLVDVVPQEIGRVLLNLFNNAFYAVAQRQKHQLTGYQPTVSVSTQRTDEHVKIRVFDNGIGISEALKFKVFQPFFTTKPTGEGTGLGLSLSYDIVTKGHGGSLTLNSEEGVGTEFIIQLPTAPVSS